MVNIVPMKIVLSKLAILMIPLLFLADNGWKVKTASVSFKIKNAGLTVDGSFSGFESDIRFNPLKPEEASIKASVKSASINTGNSMRDNHLRKAEYFDAATYPLISLQSVKIEKMGPITFNGTFKLSMKNVTKEVMIPFTFMKLPEKTEFKGSFKVNRRDYGVGGNSISMADDVLINIQILVSE